jgi:glycosyltransferase involved in cell wall biosynthesis
MTENIKFSIIIPVYNASKFIEECITSCVRQTYSNIEIICVDDFSTDNSREILKEIGKKDARINCFYHTENKSQYIARWTGFRNATGDYILFLDSDDTLENYACNLLAKTIKKYNSDIIQFGYKQKPCGEIVFIPYIASSKERISCYLAKENRCSPAVWNKAYKHSVLKNAYNTMDIFYASGPEDVYSSIVFAYFTKTSCNIQKPLLNYATDSGWSSRKEYSLNVYKDWLLSYNIVIEKTKLFISKFIPEFNNKCLEMEFYLLNDFIYNRISYDASFKLKCQILDILPLYFSKQIIAAFIDEALLKNNRYNYFLNFNGSIISNTKKLIKVILLYLKSLFK